MKTIIEKPLEFLDTTELNFNMFSEFNNILTCINNSQDMLDLRLKLNNLITRYFKYGFGSSHFWCNQIDKSERILFVDFN